MKILFFIEGMTAGGRERRLTELMKALKLKSNIQFELVIMTKEIHYPEVFGLNIKIHHLVRDRQKDMSIFRKFYKICREYKPDLVHCWDSMTAVYCTPVCKMLGIKLVNGMVVDTPMPQNMSNPHWRRARFTFPFSNLIIGNSKAGLAGYNAPVRKSVCIHNGMDLNRFANLKDPLVMRKEIFGEDLKETFTVGMVAQFDLYRKDFETVIEAAIPLLTSNDNLRFILVGEGPDLNKIKDSVPASLSDRIKFTGRRSDVESIVNIFDIGILLTNIKHHGEGISNAIIECMALGKPVIASRGGGTDEVVIDDYNGYLIDPFQKEQLIEKIKILMNNRDLRVQLGKNGHKMIWEKFDVKYMVERFINTYQALLK